MKMGKSQSIKKFILKFKEKIMKKKILLTLVLVSALICLFAISVSAASVQYQHKGMYFTLNTDAKTATFNQTNRTEYKEANLIIPGTFEYEGETYTVTSVQDRSIGYQDVGAGNKYVEYVYIPSTVTSMGSQLLRNCNNLKRIKIDASVTSFNTSDFQGCPVLEEIDLSGMTNLTSLAASLVASTSTLKTVKLPSSLKTIDSKAFQSCSSLTSIVIPNGVTTIGSNTFQSTKIETLVLPASLTSVGGAAFHSLSTVKTLVFGNTSFDGWSTNVTFNGVNPDIIFFAGADPTTLTNHYTQWNKYATMSYADYLLDPSAAGAKTIVYDTENCSCGYIKTNEPATFNFTGYTEALTYGKTCAYCQQIDVVESYKAMFVCLGWTASEENPNAAVAIRYQINKESINVYETETGKTVEYGMYATVKSALGNNAIINENGDASTGAIKVSIPEEYVNLEIKFIGIGQNTDALFALGAFVKVTKNDETKYELLEYAEPKTGDNYYFTSYNEIIGA